MREKDKIRLKRMMSGKHFFSDGSFSGKNFFGKLCGKIRLAALYEKFSIKTLKPFFKAGSKTPKFADHVFKNTKQS
ncbi:MAG: hypothetical protein R2941_02115 [Desulfobacterales bacterium]